MKRIIKEFGFGLLYTVAPLFCRKRRIDRNAVHTILAVQGGGIGDFIMAVPALHCLRHSFPKASLSLMTAPAVKQVIGNYPFCSELDEVIDFDFKRVQKRFAQKLSLLLSLRKRRYDLVYWPSRGEGMREESVMSLLIGAPNRIGFTKGRTGIFNTVSVEFSDHSSICKQNLDLLQAAGLNSALVEERFTVCSNDMQTASELLSARLGNSRRGPLVSVHPGCSWGGEFKTWPANRFRALIRELVHGMGARVVIVGSSEERVRNQGLAEGMDGSVADLSGETSVSEMAALIKMSQLFIGNDSGPLHIATALAVPAIGLFGSTSAEHLVSDMDKCVVIRKKMACSPCYSHQHRFEPICATPRCLETITVAEVYLAAGDLLRRGVQCA